MLAENFIIYYNYLSTYYVICVLMSITAIILTWVYHFKKVPSDYDNVENVFNQKSKENLEINEGAELKHILSTFKDTKKQTIEKLAASLTEDQREEEKKAEQEQLAAILKLLKEQEDKFQVGSMEELEGQLKLYRY